MFFSIAVPLENGVFGVQSMYSLRFLIIGRTEKFIDTVRNFLQNLGFTTEQEIDTDRGMEKAMSGDFNILIIDTTRNDFDYGDYLRTIIQSKALDHILAFTDKKDCIKVVESMEGDNFTCLDYPFDKNSSNPQLLISAKP